MQKDRADIVAALKAKGFGIDSKGRDHDYFFLIIGGKKTQIFTKISRGSSYKTIGDNLLGAMSRQLKLTKREFLMLVECPLSAVQYRELLRTKQIIIPSEESEGK